MLSCPAILALVIRLNFNFMCLSVFQIVFPPLNIPMLNATNIVEIGGPVAIRVILDAPQFVTWYVFHRMGSHPFRYSFVGLMEIGEHRVH